MLEVIRVGGPEDFRDAHYQICEARSLGCDILVLALTPVVGEWVVELIFIRSQSCLIDGMIVIPRQKQPLELELRQSNTRGGRSGCIDCRWRGLGERWAVKRFACGHGSKVRGLMSNGREILVPTFGVESCGCELTDTRGSNLCFREERWLPQEARAVMLGPSHHASCSHGRRRVELRSHPRRTADTEARSRP